MARTSRVELNRKKYELTRLAVADAAFAVAKEILEVVDPPDASPYGVGLLEGGGAIAYLDGKKIDGTTIGGRQIKKPRAVKPRKHVVTVAVGFGFPGRFQEMGTIKQPAKPFLTPAVMSVVPRAVSIMAGSVRKRL